MKPESLSSGNAFNTNNQSFSIPIHLLKFCLLLTVAYGTNANCIRIFIIHLRFCCFCALMVIHPAELLSLLNTHLSQTCETVEFKRTGIY